MRAIRIAMFFTIIMVWGPAVALPQPKNRNEIFFKQLHEVVQQLKQISTAEAQVRLSGKLWALFDEQVCVYLDQHNHLTVDDLNKGLRVMLQSETQIDDTHSGTAIDLYYTGDPNVLVASYEDMIWLGNGIWAMRVLHSVDNHWHIAGRIEDTSLSKEIFPHHQEMLRKESETLNKSSKDSLPSVHEQRVDRLTSCALTQMSIRVIPSSIKLLPQGGVQFITTNTIVRTIAVVSAVRWEWTPSKGLEAHAWIWGDQWVFDEKEQSDVAQWQSLDTTKKGELVKLEDLFHPE